MASKYAIMVCLDGKNDWIYVTQPGESTMWEVTPMLFDDIHIALDHARTFEIEGKEHNVKVVSYDNE